MTKDQQEKFNTLNAAWAELEPHVKDKETYKKIMGDLFRLFYKKRQDEFSDAWWQEVIDEFLGYGKKYEGTQYGDFAGDLAMGFLNFIEYRHKLTGVSFDNYVKPAFRKELQRIDKGPNRVSETVLPEPQAFHQEELHFEDPVS